MKSRPIIFVFLILLVLLISGSVSAVDTALTGYDCTNVGPPYYGIGTDSSGSIKYEQAQSFSYATADYDVNIVTIIWAGDSANAWTKDYWLRIETDSGGLPSGSQVDGNALITFHWADLCANSCYHNFTFNASIPLTAGVGYWLTLTHNEPSGSPSKLKMLGTCGSNEYTAGNHSRSVNDGAWVTVDANHDIGFWIFGEEKAPSTTPTVTAHSTSPTTVYTNTDFKFNMTATDDDNSTFTGWVQFYVNDTATGSVQSTSMNNNTNTLIGTLANANFIKGSELIAEYWAGDGEDNSTKANQSTVTVQNTAPTQPSLTEPYNNTYINSINMTWSASTDADSDTINYHILVNGTQACYTTNLYCSYSPADDFYEWNVTPYDGEDNGTVSLSRYFTYDTTNPLIDFDTGTLANNSYRNQNNVYANWTFTETNFQNITATIYNSSFALINSTIFTTATYEIDWIMSDLNELYYYNISIYDKAGNYNKTETRLITLDDTNPALTITTSNNTLSNVLSTINGTASDTNSDTIYVNNTDWDWNSDYSNWGFINNTNIADGNYNILITANDSAGNTNSLMFNFTYDGTAPIYTDLGKNNSVIKINDVVKFYANWSDNIAGLSRYIFSWNHSGSWVNDSSVALTSWSNITKTVTASKDTSVGWIIYANDSVDNWNNTGTQSFTVVNKEPNQPVLNAPADGATDQLLNTTLNITVTDSDSDLMNVSFYNYGGGEGLLFGNDVIGGDTLRLGTDNNGADKYEQAQSFNYSSDYGIETISIAFYSLAGTPTGTYHLKIETDNAGSPSGSLVDANADISFVKADIGVSYPIWHNFTFNDTIQLTKDTLYWLTLTHNEPSGSPSKEWALSRSNSNNYISGSNKQSKDDGAWYVVDANYDIGFLVYGGDELIRNETNVASGSDVTFDWSGLDYNTTYEWYVTVTDSTNTTTSPVWNFTTFAFPLSIIDGPYPANDTWLNPPINFNLTMLALEDFNCTLMINDTKNATGDYSSGANVLVNFNESLEDNCWEYYITCEDKTYGLCVNSTRNIIIVDTVKPTIVDNFINNSAYLQDTITGQFNFTDNILLHSLNISIDNSAIYTNESIDATFLQYNLSIDPATLSNGVHELFIRIADGHTAIQLKNPDAYNPSNGLFNNYAKYSIRKPYPRVDITMYLKDQSISDSWDFTKKSNRYTETVRPYSKLSTQVFIVESDKHIYIVNDPKGNYKGQWLIIGDHWKDFVLKDEPGSKVSIKRITNNKVEVTISGIKNIEELIFDSTGDLNIVTKTYNFYVSNNSINSPDYSFETDYQTITFFLNKTGSVTTNAELYWNGSFKTSSKTSYTNYDKYTAVFRTPFITSKEENITAYWDYNVTDGSTESNNITFNQTAYRMSIDICSEYNTSAINFTLMDEVLNEPLNISGEIHAAMQISRSNVSDYRTTNLDYSGSSNYSLCIYPSWAAYTIDFTSFEYMADGYANREYSTSAFEISNTTQEIKLYLISLEDSTNVIISLRDSNDDVLEGYNIRTKRYYPATGEEVTSEISRTDYNGQAISRLVLYNYYYSFSIEELDGTVIKLISPSKIYSSSLTFIIDIEEEELNFEDKVWYSISPDSPVQSQAVNFSLTTVSPGLYIEWFAIGTRFNSTNYLDNSTDADGGTVTIEVDLTNQTGWLSITYYIQAANETLLTFDRGYFVTDIVPGDYSIEGQKSAWEDIFNVMWRVVAAVLISIIAVLLLVPFIGPESAGVVGVLTQIGFTIMGWIPLWMIIVEAVILIGLYLMSNRGQV